jgi:sugar lactone lactonase YvrE
LEKVWGRRGIGDGEFQTPRAIEIDDHDHLYIVDKAARIQVFTRQGEFLRGWRTPLFANGKPTGLSWDNEGRLMVADTHYFRILFYTPEGQLLEHLTIGGQEGYDAPGRFGWVTDAVQDSRGNYYISEYGEFDRVQKYSPDRQFLFQWGGHGNGPLEFKRPQSLDVDASDHLWVADACNHRIQVFDATGGSPQLLRTFGELGSKPGQLRYPYNVTLDNKGHFYVCEFGNHRVQKFTVDGQLVASWGSHGRQAGQLHNPWAVVRDSRGRIHVLDTYNNRVQRIRL